MLNMTLYIYKCQSCGLEEETWAYWFDITPQRCSKCGGDMVRTLSKPSLDFKGSGFYKTDYERKSK